VVGCIGRLSAEKGQRLLIEVFPEVLRAVPSARLLLAGDGPDLPRLRDRAETLALGDAVRFLGHRQDILDVYGSLDLLVLCSDTEGLPNVVLEAMALGVPVVATAVGGTPELVIDGRTGWLVPPAEPVPLGRAIVEALRRREEAAERAAAARRHVEADFDMMGLIRRTHDLYRRFLGASQRKGAP
jgi:glycosyltransferase involved in cell wall biosynthesis